MCVTALWFGSKIFLNFHWTFFKNTQISDATSVGEASIGLTFALFLYWFVISSDLAVISIIMKIKTKITCRVEGPSALQKPQEVVVRILLSVWSHNA